MTEEPIDGFKALAEFWSAQGKAMLDAQQSAARSMVEGMQSMFGAGSAAPSDPELAKASDSMMQLWAAASGLSTDLVGQLVQATGASDATRDVFERITSPRYWIAGGAEMDNVLARMVDAPRLADLFDVERRYGSVMRRWTELQQRNAAHQRVLLDAWMRTSQAFMTELANRAGAAGKVLEPKQAVAIWAEIGNRQMLETQRSDAFLRSQREVIRASTELRLAQAELSEHVGKQYGLPTRTELDDVHRSLTEMRRELRRTRRELDALQLAKAAPPSAVGTLPTKGRTSTKPKQPVSSMRKAR